MSQPDSPRPLAVRIDEACSRFEQAWRSGPRLEDFAEGFSGQERLALLRELAQIDVEYRRRHGEEGRLEDYVARFPELAGVLQRTAATPCGDAPSPATAPPVGRVGDVAAAAGRVGDYEFLSVLDAGGMGVVHRATDHALGREVAVKVLGADFAPDSGAAGRFRKEARITAQLQHPAIPPVHQVGELPDGRPFLAMKLIKGCKLDEALQSGRGAADLGRNLAAFEQICQAVAYAHSRGVIHRDLKPQNIMLGAFGEVQVMDWGLAKVLGGSAGPEEPALGRHARTVITPPPDSDGSNTQAGSMMGTPAFMPPEQAGGETDKVGRRADVFGLGAILAVILTGQPPYVGKSAEVVRLMAIRGQTAACLDRLDACGAEPALVALCKRCLAFEPDERPADAAAVAAEVARLRAAAEERARHAEVEAAYETRANAALEQERDRALLALAAQAAERLQSELKQLEQVGEALAVLAQQADLDERHLEAWMRGMVRRDERIFGLTVAFEPGHGPRPAEYCLYVSRKGGDVTREHLHAQGYDYRRWDWYGVPLRTGQARWAPAPSRDEGGADTPIIAYLAPLLRAGRAAGVATVDLSLQDFFGASRLGGWLDQLHLGQRGRSYGFVVSHTRTLWDGDDPGKEARRFWGGEPGTGVFISHPRYLFPQRIQDLPGVSAEFAALAGRVLRRDADGGLAEPRGKARAVDPVTGSPSTLLFARVPSPEWTLVVVIEEAADAAGRPT